MHRSKTQSFLNTLHMRSLDLSSDLTSARFIISLRALPLNAVCTLVLDGEFHGNEVEIHYAESIHKYKGCIYRRLQHPSWKM